MFLSNIKKTYVTLVGILLLLLTLVIKFVPLHNLSYANQEDNITYTEIPSVQIVSEEYVESESSEVIDVIEETGIYVPPLVQAMNQGMQSAASLYQGDEYDFFFEHSVFVGDSLSVGFTDYCRSHADSIACDTTYFLAKQSCSAQIAISSNALTSYASVMPTYNGMVQYIEDSIYQMDDVEKVFICFGMNDLVGVTPEVYINNMQTLVDRILDKRPDVSIYLMSIPCIVADAHSGFLSNSSIQEANNLLASLCDEKDWGFVNIAEFLMDENNAINPSYSSDGYVHENSSAYAIWVSVLRNYAYEGMFTDESKL